MILLVVIVVLAHKAVPEENKEHAHVLHGETTKHLCDFFRLSQRSES